MRPRTILTSVILITALSGTAHALDGYRDRRGLFGSLQLVGGMLKPEVGDNDEALGVAVRAGAGLSQALTFDLTLGHQSSLGDSSIHDIQLGVSVYFSDWGRDEGPANPSVFLRVGGGMLHRANPGEMGFGAAIGAGFEMPIGADLAANIGLSYQPAFIDGTRLDRFLGGLTVTWY